MNIRVQSPAAESDKCFLFTGLTSGLLLWPPRCVGFFEYLDERALTTEGWRGSMQNAPSRDHANLRRARRSYLDESRPMKAGRHGRHGCTPPRSLTITRSAKGLQSIRSDRYEVGPGNSTDRRVPFCHKPLLTSGHARLTEIVPLHRAEETRMRACTHPSPRPSACPHGCGRRARTRSPLSWLPSATTHRRRSCPQEWCPTVLNRRRRRSPSLVLPPFRSRLRRHFVASCRFLACRRSLHRSTQHSYNTTLQL